MTGFILAGGYSTRMGRDKALLAAGSQTLIEVVIRRLRSRADRVIAIGNAHNIRQLRALPLDDVLLDLAPGYGPLMGVLTGLMQTKTPMNCFVSCDMPWVQGPVLDRLTGACQGDGRVVASLHPYEGIQPLPIVCHVSACRTVGALLDRGARSLHSLLSEPGSRLVHIEEPRLWRSFINVNTIEDYEAFRHEYADAP